MLATLTSVLTRQSNARPGEPHFGPNFPLCGAKHQSNDRGVGGGGGRGGVGIGWYINYTKSYADIVGKDQFFYLDTSSGTTEARPARPLYNEGFATRKIFKQ